MSTKPAKIMTIPYNWYKHFCDYHDYTACNKTAIASEAVIST